MITNKDKIIYLKLFLQNIHHRAGRIHKDTAMFRNLFMEYEMIISILKDYEPDVEVLTLKSIDE